MRNNQCLMGKQSIRLEEPVYIQSAASIVGKKEGEGPLGKWFDLICEDPMFGMNTWEEAESTMQKEALLTALRKGKIGAEEIRMVFAGDLLAQTMASSFGVAELEIPLYGLYGACSTLGEALALSAMAVSAGFAPYAAAVTSSHFASAEKEFRFPLGYGNQRPLSATWTVTGSGACILGDKKSRAGITEITTGKIVDYGLRDSLNMGGCMAPAAGDTIYRHLRDFNRTVQDYDCIITGDLGSVGQKILFDLLGEKKVDISERHMDCGIEIFDAEKQDTHAGGSGCGCSAVVFASYILPKIVSGQWRRVLLVPTGALLSKVSYNEGKSVPGIAQAVVIEHIEKGKEQEWII